jgi:hypothetical protein
MKIGLRSLLIAVAGAALMFVPPTERADATVQQQGSTAKAKRPVHRHVTKHSSRGYGFLPGYRPQLPNSIPLYSSTRARSAAARAAMTGEYEMRYWHYGQYLYGWGRPRYYRGRWNGGSFGPCWTTTPIGMMWTCGR